jgi:uncharacterized protein
MRVVNCLVFAGLLAVAGCAVRSPAAELWTLAPLAIEPPQWDDGAPAIAIAPVELPRHLDRPQLVVRLGPTRIEPDQLHRWAEPLDEGLGRVLAANLGRRLASRRVSAYPLSPSYGIDYRVQLDVERFDGRPGDALVLALRWTIADGGGEVLAVERDRFELAAGAGVPGLVQAHSEALAVLAEALERRIRELAGAR